MISQQKLEKIISSTLIECKLILIKPQYYSLNPDVLETIFIEKILLIYDLTSSEEFYLHSFYEDQLMEKLSFDCSGTIWANILKDSREINTQNKDVKDFLCALKIAGNHWLAKVTDLRL